MRYICYGKAIAEHEDDNSDVNPSDSHLIEASEVYSTEDIEEAKTIVRNGGFINSSEVFVAVQWAEDSQTGGIFGDKPQTTAGYNATQDKTIKKSDFA